MSNVIQLSIRRQEKAAVVELDAYRLRIASLDKQSLMEEMVKFQEERSRLGYLNIDMIQKGIVLFKELETAAETKELQLLTRSYRRHLEHELNVKRN